MGSKLCPKIILEGTRLTFKTDIAFALNEHPRIVGPRKYRAAARAERLKVSGNPKQYDDLSAFVKEQELMERLVSDSILPTLRLDLSDNDIPRAVDRIADWPAGNGGLFAPPTIPPLTS